MRWELGARWKGAASSADRVGPPIRRGVGAQATTAPVARPTPLLGHPAPTRAVRRARADAPRRRHPASAASQRPEPVPPGFSAAPAPESKPTHHGAGPAETSWQRAARGRAGRGRRQGAARQAAGPGRRQGPARTAETLRVGDLCAQDPGVPDRRPPGAAGFGPTGAIEIGAWQRTSRATVKHPPRT